ncbi:DUF6377 domain-containing protein [Bacteroides intestinalis]|jgi:hypothetical protein|uniref:Transcriptional regulator n=1 Tax=Bacteroides intestinalis TaxID=329854 RepID=A0A4Q5HC23_9BACE|nr:DUF6377 domain-containing protein [Bacteroides intestinalis]KAA4688889.1 DUF948 domain-containing protein [Bacteroides intestinalis]KAA4721766.1 DUF948 domain-containing protein [Bacteroides intestinalis]RHE81975.1 transcriptional regulator [Bacteroides intestinalis]RYT78586.1 transcriptional regulator [Bacteroides intestinalis]
MKSGLFILIVCLLFPAYVCADTSKHALEENRKLLHSLDSLLEQQDLFVRVKEKRIKQLKMQYSRVKDVKELYAMNRMVYLEYRVYDADSALHYINKNIQLAQQTNNRTWEVVSLLEQSFVLTSSGLLTEALKAVSDIQPEELPQNLRSEYFGRLCTLYSRLRDYSSENSQLSEHYNNLQKAFRDSVYLTATPDELRYWNCRAWLYMGTPEIEPVKQAFEENKQTLSNDSRKYSIATYNLSAIYRSENNESKYLENLILSAMADIRSVNGDIGSLQEIAEYLFKHGEIDRAYNYILYCSQKAMLFHNRVRIVKMSHLQNQIYKAYQEQSRTQQKRLQASLIAVSFLFLVLIGAFLFIRKQMRRLKEANLKLDSTNQKLSVNMDALSTAHQRLEEVNIQLKDLNTQLQEVNDQLRESNYVKEEYIGYVFNICSTYISKLEEFRKNINRKLKVGQIEDVKAMTDSSATASNELKEFYQNFDTIFLHLYPDFVGDFNALLLPEERIELKEGELLNTELRIHALIRLGITDSVKIADFLHCSAQTVYNNRLRTRNKSIIPKEDFINAVKKLGKYKA